MKQGCLNINNHYHIIPDKNQLLDYNKFDNADYSEDMMLNLLYENFFNIEKELIDIANKIANN